MFFLQARKLMCHQMACIYLINNRGFVRTFSFDIHFYQNPLLLLLSLMFVLQCLDIKGDNLSQVLAKWPSPGPALTLVVGWGRLPTVVMARMVQ